MSQRFLFIDRRGVRIDDRWIRVPGRALPLADVHEVRIVEDPPDSRTVGVVRGSAAVSLCALVAAYLTGPFLLRLSAMTVVAIALVIAVCVAQFRPLPMSVETVHGGRAELLITTDDGAFANQIGRAVMRASEWNNLRLPAVYRVIAPRTAVSLPIAVTAVVAVGTAYLVAQSLASFL